MTDLQDLYNSSEVLGLIGQTDLAWLDRDLTNSTDVRSPAHVVSRLRVAAYVALADLLGSDRIDTLLRELAAEEDPLQVEDDVAVAFQSWGSLLREVEETNNPLSLDDLFGFATIGLMARRPTEVRTVLRSAKARTTLSATIEASRHYEWSARVKARITISFLLLVGQESHADVKLAAELVNELSVDQRLFESEWLNDPRNDRRSAVYLLGLYHLAEVTILLADFIRNGSVVISERTFQDFAPRLRSLLVRAEEYILLAGDIESQVWLNSVAVVGWRLRTDSIWVSGRAISARIDDLISTLVSDAREKPVFSLLPSQQSAIQKSLLDPSRIAVVLQMPTSSGKTLLAEFAIVQAFETYRKEARVVYLVPTRALATQVRRTLAEDLGPLGIRTAPAGSAFEEDPFELELLDISDGIVVSTPEKLDLLLRTKPEWFEKLRLVVVDEAHLLQDGERGVRLELLLANLRREHPQTRLLLLTPFLENAKQIATWLGGTRGLPIDVRWRPSRLLVGLARFGKQRSEPGKRYLSIEWDEPHRKFSPIAATVFPAIVSFPESIPAPDVSNNTKRVRHISRQLAHLGTVLALYAASPAAAEEAAVSHAETQPRVATSEQTAALRLAVALARDEYGPKSRLAFCLERGTAFHHSSLSQLLRYLIEDQIRAKTLRFVAATTTLAQGMNFPVSAVIVHSVHKPRGAGDLTPAEFWNIAGRAGRVGLADRGFVVFANEDHRGKLEHYARELDAPVRSALLSVLKELGETESVKSLYSKLEKLRPFIQYLAHAAASWGVARAMEQLDELLEASLAITQIENASDAQVLRRLARGYLDQLSSKPLGYLKRADSTGLGSFSFDQLLARVNSDDVLMRGPGEVLSRPATGLVRLIDALKDLPELSLAMGFGSGNMNVHAVARVVEGWINGSSIPDLARDFPGDSEEEKIRGAARYLFSTVSQTISWGTHAYVKGWGVSRGSRSTELSPDESMLASFIQYGVRTPEAAVASLLGIPRQFAESFADEYRRRHGSLTPERTSLFRDFIEGADIPLWRTVSSNTTMANYIDPADVRMVWRQAQGLSTEGSERDRKGG